MSDYDDIIDLPHYVSASRMPMSMESRAAQFAPFAALSGHDAAIAETARLTSAKSELSAEDFQRMSRRLSLALESASPVDITYFLPDETKQGGRYVAADGIVKRIDTVDGTLTLSDGRQIPLADILAIEGDIFDGID